MGLGQGSSASPFATSVLGSWAAAPKAAREAYEQYIKLISTAMGGERMGGELLATSQSVWEALLPLPAELDSDPISARLSLSTRLKPFRSSTCSLCTACGLYLLSPIVLHRIPPAPFHVTAGFLGPSARDLKFSRFLSWPSSG